MGQISAAGWVRFRLPPTLAVVNGQITVEALVDDVPSPKLQEAFQGAGWSLPANGFASLRWFLAASPRVGGPTHRIERNCQQ